MKNQPAKSFYSNRLWGKARKKLLARDSYLCQRCFEKGFLTQAEVVHHIDHLSRTPDRALEESNLINLSSG